jgi:hypothetical protein
MAGKPALIGELNDENKTFIGGTIFFLKLFSGEG